MSLEERRIEVGLYVGWPNGGNGHGCKKERRAKAKFLACPCLRQCPAPILDSPHAALASTRTAIMSYAQPHPRQSILSNSSHSSVEHLSPTASSTRFSLPVAPSIHSTLASTARPASNRVVPNIYDRNLSKARTAEVSASAYAFLFSEIVQYTQNRVSGINDFERRCDTVL